MNESAYWKNKWQGRPLEPANNFAIRAYKLIKIKKYATLLDVGCGNGRDSIYFSNKGLRVTAVDFSKTAINKLRARDKKINCILQDIKNINFKPNTFDVIYAHLSLHYFDDKTTTQIFSRLYKLLKKDGVIFIKCKSTDDALYGQGKLVGEDMWKKEYTRHFFTKEYMTQKLKNFKIIKVQKTSSVYHEYKSAFIEAIATK